MKGRDRNAPCWCGSGKKYKKCHLDRDSQPRDNLWANAEATRKAFSKKKCWAYGVGLGKCEGRVIKAHTVSCGPNLSQIAKNGHVLQYVASIPDMNKNGGKLSVKKIGIKEASVFYGFCEKHDRELFSCLENEAFTGRPDQCLAVAYRTLSRDLYGKDASASQREIFRGGDKGLSLSQQIIFQSILDARNTGNEAARRELKATHDALTTALVSVRPGVISSVIFEFSAPLPFMFAGAWSPATDLYGAELQEGFVDELLEPIIVSSFASEKSAMICFSWRNIVGAPGQVIAEQFMKLPDEQIASACLQFVVKHIDNIFFNPDWFISLNYNEREQLNKLAADGINILGNAPSMPIHLGLDFQLPKSIRSFKI